MPSARWPSLFLLWLIYVHPASATLPRATRFLPNLNAVLNGLSAIALLAGFYFIRRRELHGASNQHDHRLRLLLPLSGELYRSTTRSTGIRSIPVHGTVYRVYLAILISHIILAVVALPVVLITFFLSLSGRIRLHRRWRASRFRCGCTSR